MVAVDGVVTLREALEAANTNTPVGDAPAGSSVETDVITFAEALFDSGPAVITLGGSQLEIADDVEIRGPGAKRLTVDAEGLSRVFYVDEGVDVAIDGLAVTGWSVGGRRRRDRQRRDARDQQLDALGQRGYRRLSRWRGDQQRRHADDRQLRALGQRGCGPRRQWWRDSELGHALDHQLDPLGQFGPGRGGAGSTGPAAR